MEHHRDEVGHAARVRLHDDGDVVGEGDWRRRGRRRWRRRWRGRIHQVVEGVDGEEVIAVAYDGWAGWCGRRYRGGFVQGADDVGVVCVLADGDEAKAGLVLRVLELLVSWLLFSFVLFAAAAAVAMIVDGGEKGEERNRLLTSPELNSRDVQNIQIITRIPPARTMVLTLRREL